MRVRPTAALSTRAQLISSDATQHISGLDLSNPASEVWAVLVTAMPFAGGPGAIQS